MSIPVSGRQYDFVNEIAIREGFTSYKLIFNQGSSKGDGYTGSIYFVTILENSTGKKLDLVLKAAHKGDEFREKLHVDIFYDRESYMYSVIFKVFRELEQEFKVKNVFDGLAKYYGNISQKYAECVVMENLTQNGFQLWDRRKPMNSDHVNAVISQYGKYHALSYAMKTLKPDLFSEKTKDLHSIFFCDSAIEETRKSMKTMMEIGIKAVQGNSKATDALEKFQEILEDFFSENVNTRDEYSVILHGDCWCNNIMFKYKGTDSREISKVYVLDWQLSYVGNPLLDLCSFFYSCSSKECLDNYHSFMRIYHDSLTDSLNEFNIDVNDVFPFKKLEEQWKIFAKYGMYMSFLLIKIMLTEQDEAKDVNNISKDDSFVDNFFGGEISNSSEFKQRIFSVINHMIDNNFI